MMTNARKFCLSSQEKSMLKYKKMTKEGKTEQQADREIAEIVKSLNKIKKNKSQEEKKLNRKSSKDKFKEEFSKLCRSSKKNRKEV